MIDKLASIKSMLEITGTAQDDQLNAYLTLTEAEIIGWLYSNNPPEDASVPDRYVVTQIMAVIAGYNMIGAEGQLSHSENGISRQWKHADMVSYVRANVIPYAVVV